MKENDYQIVLKPFVYIDSSEEEADHHATDENRGVLRECNAGTWQNDDDYQARLETIVKREIDKI